MTFSSLATADATRSIDKTGEEIEIPRRGGKFKTDAGVLFLICGSRQDCGVCWNLCQEFDESKRA